RGGGGKRTPGAGAGGGGRERADGPLHERGVDRGRAGPAMHLGNEQARPAALAERGNARVTLGLQLGERHAGDALGEAGQVRVEGLPGAAQEPGLQPSARRSEKVSANAGTAARPGTGPGTGPGTRPVAGSVAGSVVEPSIATTSASNRPSIRSMMFSRRAHSATGSRNSARPG